LPRRTIRRRPIIAIMIAVLHPLPDVASHVIEAKRIGGERANRRRMPPVPLAAAAVTIGVVLADLVAPIIGCRCTGASRVLPFGRN
jgi:uncharacterized protein YqgC (DUF456 family)